MQFFPVVHLLTGPPGLTRNGGIWKKLKAGLAEESRRPKIMVQALHFAQYNISVSAWEDWIADFQGRTRLHLEIDGTFGSTRDVFVDSGGFQLLYVDKLDLSRWRMRICPEDILALQLRYGASRIASLDSPIPPSLGIGAAHKLAWKSIKNAAWLAEHSPHASGSPLPYLVVHGRSSTEIEWYLKRLQEELPQGWLRRGGYGIALGSQVPLAGDPGLVLENVRAVLGWMAHSTAAGTPLHLFGVGDAIVGEITRTVGALPPLSYDNSTYIQSAFRMKAFNPKSKAYEPFDPFLDLGCTCHGCNELGRLGREGVAEILAHRAYRPVKVEAGLVNRSDVLAFLGLHNLHWWRSRLQLTPRRYGALTSPSTTHSLKPRYYEFPLTEFATSTGRLLLLPCSKKKPYGTSRSHRLVIDHLKEYGLEEGRDYDRITLSGLFGPVHWRHELNEAILGYDFRLSSMTDRQHSQTLRLRTANVLRVTARQYKSTVAYLRSRCYSETFGPVIQEFGGQVVDDMEALPKHLSSS